jgi:glycosyltransferase involved in cell wall biosynthesis
MSKPKLHVLFPFHTEPIDEFSHCAFTGKGERFVEMMINQGYEVVEYSNGRSNSEKYATERVQILTTDELNELRVRQNNGSNFHGDNALIGGEIWKEFHPLCAKQLKDRLDSKDIVCHIFGHPHADYIKFGGIHVETGIGYPQTWSNFRIFESAAWMHYHAGKAKRQGNNYEWIVPNYYKATDWQFNETPEDYYLFAGRICSVKGMDTLLAIAERKDIKIKIAGQGDPSPWINRLPEDKRSRLEYVGHVTGKDRAILYGKAKAFFAPTNFIEPFCGVAVEAQLCGTPIISSHFGAFQETVEHGKTGFRCHTLGDYLESIDKVLSLDRKYISDRANSLYTYEPCGKKYDAIFQQLYDLHNGGGWYTCKSQINVLS